MHGTDIVAYTFDADIYCVPCTERTYPGSTDWRADGFDPADYTDSEGNEVNPVFASGSESDVPEHCGSCGTFLENDLTAEGYGYVVAALRDCADGSPETLAEWWDAYSPHFDASDWQEIAEAWWPSILRTMPLNRAVRIERNGTDGADVPGEYGKRFPTVSFLFNRPTDADDAYRPFRKDDA